VTLAEFLLARVTEDEKWARARRDEDFVKHRVGRRPHLAPDDAERVLAHCRGTRLIVGRFLETASPYDSADQQIEHEQMEMWVLPALALPFADHPDYRQEFKP
jgi:hypothetical protein